MKRRAGAALAGMAAAAVAVGTGELVAVVTGPRSAPLVAVGATVIDAVPGPVKQWAVTVFGRHDKTALQVGTLILLGAGAAGVGLAALRGLRYALAGLTLFALVGVGAAVSRYGAGPGAVAPSLVGAAAAAGVLRWLLLRAGLDGPVPAVAPQSAGPPRPGPAGTAGDPVPAVPVVPAAPAVPVAMTGVQRRQVLTGSAVAIGAAAVAGVAGRKVATRRGIAQARAAVRLPSPADPAPEVPAGAELDLAGLDRYVTANRDFYRIDTALVVPAVDPDTWRLRVHGRVRRPVTVSFADLLRRPMVERYLTLACVSNEVGGRLVGNARWLGVPVRELLAEAQPLEGADQVVSRSADGWTCGTPTAALLDGRDALLAVGMNGAPLPIEHGFPVRMVVPGLYGYVSACKWITELELTSFADYDAYWVSRGWAALGPVRIQSRIDTPRGGVELSAGPVPVAGVAWAQHQGVGGVQVRVDDGPWETAEIAATVSVDTWRQWSWRWPAQPGRHTLTVRALDLAGQAQTGQQRPVAPDGATGWHSVEVTVR